MNLNDIKKLFKKIVGESIHEQYERGMAEKKMMEAAKSNGLQKDEALKQMEDAIKQINAEKKAGTFRVTTTTANATSTPVIYADGSNVDSTGSIGAWGSSGGSGVGGAGGNGSSGIFKTDKNGNLIWETGSGKYMPAQPYLDPYGSNPYKTIPYPYTTYPKTSPNITPYGENITPEQMEEWKEALRKSQMINNDINSEPWKVQIMEKLINLVANPETHKHPNPEWSFSNFFRANFNYGLPDDVHTIANWLCRESEQPIDNYKKLFSLDEFIFALFGDSYMKMDCDHTEPCECPGQTTTEYNSEQLQGDKPFEYLMDYLKEE